MKSIAALLVLLSTVVTLPAIAQEAGRIFGIGLIADSHLTWQINNDYSNFEDENSPGLGWKIGMIGAIDPLPAIVIQPAISVVFDDTRRTTTVFYDGTTTNTWKSKLQHMWMEGSATMMYKPLRRSSLSVLTGLGISARRIIRSSIKSTLSGPGGYGASSWEFTMTDYLFNWNYFLIPQIGVEIRTQNSGRLFCLINYHHSLRQVYRPYEPNPTFDYAFVPSRHKLISAGLSVAWVWGIKPRTYFRGA
jgi:hypothetical protein